MPENTIAIDDIHDRLNQYALKDFINKDLLTAYEGWSIKKLSSFFVKHKVSGAPVIAADDELVGVVTQSDIVRFESREPSEREMKKLVQQYCGPFGGTIDPAEIRRMQGKANEYCTVNSIMTPSVISTDVNTSLEKACHTIIKMGIHRLFVTEKGILIGVISAMDLLKLLVTEE